jgi:hypothetical protein
MLLPASFWIGICVVGGIELVVLHSDGGVPSAVFPLVAPRGRLAALRAPLTCQFLSDLAELWRCYLSCSYLEYVLSSCTSSFETVSLQKFIRQVLVGSLAVLLLRKSNQ